MAGPWRVGLIGTGGISAAHIAGWRHLGADLMLYARSGAAQTAHRIGARSATSVRQLIHGNDIIGVLSPSTTHHEYALAALAAGKHVLCEKPLGRTVAEAIDIARAAADSTGVLHPAHVVRYFPAYAAAFQRVVDGDIGPLLAARFERAGAAPAPGSWFFDEQLSGGIIMDQLIHDLDQARWFAGEVLTVYAVQSPGPEQPASMREQATASITLTHRGGTTTHVHGMWGPPGTTFTTQFDLLGREGTLRYSSRTATGLTRDPAPDDSWHSTDYIPASDPATSPFTRQLEDFLQAISTGNPAQAVPVDGVIAVAIAEAARKSVRSGVPQAIDEAALRDAVQS